MAKDPEDTGVPLTPNTQSLYRRYLERIKASSDKNFAVYLVNGIRLDGALVDFDDESILMTAVNMRSENLIRWGAVSTIVPGNMRLDAQRPVRAGNTNPRT